MTRPGLYAHALRAARSRQLAGRALRPLRRRRFSAGKAPRTAAPVVGAVEFWRSPAFEHAPLTDLPESRLAGFHRHYGEDVLAAARAGDAQGGLRAARAWIAEHPPRAGDPWHPYVASTRLGNWVAAGSLLPEILTADVSESLWRQLVYVARNVEDDVLGNHVIRNARALALGGAAFGDLELLDQAVALLERELPEQVLPDGGHYERSPVYHLVVLRDLLEVRAATGNSFLDEPVERMRRFASALARPDGMPALFNDGFTELAPALELPPAPAGLSVFPETGYAVLRDEELWLAFDCGPPSPPFLPAHAHADALSFQLWLGGRPIVVDPGTYTYEPGPDRDWFRSTRSHSTVSIGGGDQFELWGAFRSGPLPRVHLLGTNPLQAEVIWPGGERHRRTIVVEREAIAVADDVHGGPAESALPIEEPERAEPVEAPLRDDRGWVSERLGERRAVAVLRADGGRGWRIGR
jgi:uncharacterized heparinase superfamily protein